MVTLYFEIQELFQKNCFRVCSICSCQRNIALMVSIDKVVETFKIDNF